VDIRVGNAADTREAAMADQPVSIQDVLGWIRESLAEYQGRYEVQDLTFVSSAVRVVTPRRDARYDVKQARWNELLDGETRPTLTADLQRWARQYLGA
jgi:hypothetical protein